MDKIVKSKNKTISEINTTHLDFENLSQYAFSSTPIVDIRSKLKRKHKKPEINAIKSIMESDEKDIPRKEILSHNTSLHSITHVEAPRSKRKRKHKDTEIDANKSESNIDDNLRKEEPSRHSLLHTHKDVVETPMDPTSKRKRKDKNTKIVAGKSKSEEEDNLRKEKLSHTHEGVVETLMDPTSKRKRKHKETEIVVTESKLDSDKKNNPRKEKLSSTPTLHKDVVENQINILDKTAPIRDSTGVEHTSINMSKRKKINKSRLINSLTNKQITSRNYTGKSFTKVTRRMQIAAALKEVKKLPDYFSISKMLTEPEKETMKRKRYSHLPYPTTTSTIFWNTYNYLEGQIEKCLFQNDWNNMTKLLILLTDAPKDYRKFILKATLLNFICNPASQENELIVSYLKECLSCQSDQDINTLLTSNFHIQNVDNVQETND